MGDDGVCRRTYCTHTDFILHIIVCRWFGNRGRWKFEIVCFKSATLLPSSVHKRKVNKAIVWLYDRLMGWRSQWNFEIACFESAVIEIISLSSVLNASGHLLSRAWTSLLCDVTALTQIVRCSSASREFRIASGIPAQLNFIRANSGSRQRLDVFWLRGFHT